MTAPLGTSQRPSPLDGGHSPSERLDLSSASPPPELQNRPNGPARSHSSETAPAVSSLPASRAPLTSSSRPARPRRPDAPPPLSERDTPFATSWNLAPDSNVSTPSLSASTRPGKGDANQDVGPGEYLPGPVSSAAPIASSLLASGPERPHKMHMAPEAAPFSHRPAEGHFTALLDTTESHKQLGDRPLQEPGTLSQEEEVGEENWDRPKEETKSRPSNRRHRSDEQIQATLANEEPINHARSRKASHYLGLFRENAKEKKQQRKSRERAKEVYTGKETDQEDYSELDERQRAAEAEAQERGKFGDASNKTARSSEPLWPALETATSQESDAVLSPTRESSDTSPQEPDKSVEWFSEGAAAGAYPIRLLEEIRAHPVANRHSKDKRRDSSPVDPLTRRRPTDSVQSPVRNETVVADDQPLTLPPSADIEGDDSDKEHISAATYFPHQAPSPDDIQGQEKRGGSFDDIGEPAISPRTTPKAPSQPTEPTEHRDIENKTWKLAKDDEATAPKQTADDSQPGPPPRRVDTGLSTVSETEYESLDDDVDDLDELADVECTPTATPRVKPTKVKKSKRRSRSPLGAVELKPYKHQVGGHTKVFSFSKQAICKELNNRENSFYEVIERRHPELLDFMPRYLGVLNVTYTKAKRKPVPMEEPEPVAPSTDTNGTAALQQHEDQANQESQGRVISHSKNFSANDETIPRVIYANNMHIIPSHLFPNSPSVNGHPRPATANGSIDPGSTGRSKTEQHDSKSEDGNASKQSSLPSRPSVNDLPSWGATTVNLKLKERVLRDVFSPPTVYPKHRQRVRKALTNDSFSDPKASLPDSPRRTPNKDELLSAALLKAHSDLTPVSSHEDVHRGGSVPIHHASFSSLRDRSSVDSNISETASKGERHVARRRSDQGLQRSQCDIDTSNRTGLNYYEDDELINGKDDSIFAMDIQSGISGDQDRSDDVKVEPRPTPPQPQDHSNANTTDLTQVSKLENQDAPGAPSKLDSLVPAPVNPLQAQIHADERVRHFLLLEDLTANMVKPCVLDLKMGTRQYGIEANQKKRLSQRMKCKMTTSRQLGVRLCGMQVWNVKKQEYGFEDKYIGRDLKAGKEFQAALRRFLYDGVSPASVTRHIPVLLDKLSRLEQIVSQLPRYRFYASSLLLIYDGADLPSQRSIERGGKADHDGADASGKDVNVANKDKTAPSNIDIRLVDFANCVTSQTKRLADAPSPPHHPNHPDRGYIKGLRSLRSYLQRIWMEINTEEAGSWVERGEGEAMAIAQQGAGNADQPEGWRKAGESADTDGDVSE